MGSPRCPAQGSPLLEGGSGCRTTDESAGGKARRVLPQVESGSSSASGTKTVKRSPHTRCVPPGPSARPVLLRSTRDCAPIGAGSCVLWTPVVGETIRLRGSKWDRLAASSKSFIAPKQSGALQGVFGYPPIRFSHRSGRTTMLIQAPYDGSSRTGAPAGEARSIPASIAPRHCSRPPTAAGHLPRSSRALGPLASVTPPPASS